MIDCKRSKNNNNAKEYFRLFYVWFILLFYIVMLYPVKYVSSNYLVAPKNQKGQWLPRDSNTSEVVYHSSMVQNTIYKD